jgi:hypothetical protein
MSLETDAIAKIHTFDLGWNVRIKRGIVRLKFANGAKIVYKVDSISDLAGWAALANKAEAYARSDGWILTGPDAMGEVLYDGTEVPFPFFSTKIQN